MSCLVHSHKYKESEFQTNANSVSMSTLYKLHLHPVIIPSTSFDTIRLDNTKFKDTDSIDGSMTHDMEAGIFAKVHAERIISSLRLGIPSRPPVKSSPPVRFRLPLWSPAVSDFIRILQANLCIQPMEMTTRFPKQRRLDQYPDSIVKLF